MNPNEMFDEVDKYVDLIGDHIAPVLDLLGLDKDQINAEAHAFVDNLRTNTTGHRDPAGGVRLGDDPVRNEPTYPPFDQMLEELRAEADKVWGEGNHGWTNFNPNPDDNPTSLMKVLGYENIKGFVQETYGEMLKGEWPKGHPRGM